MTPKWKWKDLSPAIRVPGAIGGLLLAVCGVTFVAMGLALLLDERVTRLQAAVAILVCLGPGLAMAETGVRITIGRPRRGGGYVHPAARVAIGVTFIALGILVLAGGIAERPGREPLEDLLGRLLLGVAYVALGGLAVRGRLLGPGTERETNREVKPP